MCAVSKSYTRTLSIHDLTRRSTRLAPYSGNSSSFQFTTSQGGRLEAGFNVPIILVLSIHDLTRRSTS